MDDLLGNIEKGDITLSYSLHDLLQMNFYSTIRNEVYLNHLIEELHPKRSRKAILKKLDDEVRRAYNEATASLAAMKKL
jgi:hypothetical protein